MKRNRKSILIVIPYCGTSHKGINAIRRIEKLLDSYDVVIFSNSFQFGVRTRARLIEVCPMHFDYLRRLCHLPNEISLAIALRNAVIEFLKSAQASLIICHGYTLAYVLGRYIKATHKVPYAMFMHGHIFERPSGTYPWALSLWYQRIAKSCYHNSDAIIALSESQSSLASVYIGKHTKMLVLPNGLDSRDLGIELLNYPPRKYSRGFLSLLYVGRVSQEKGILTLLRTCCILKAKAIQYKLTIIGGLSSSFNLQKELKSLSLENQIDYIGEIDRNILCQYYLAADILCVPSVSEPFGTVALEGMATGCIVIASNTGGLASIIEHERTGFLAPIGNHVKFADLIEIVLRNKKYADQIRVNAFAEVNQNYKWSEIGLELLSFISANFL
jgi:glycosyltransferase involved in cell wall biosynthesis